MTKFYRSGVGLRLTPISIFALLMLALPVFAEKVKSVRSREMIEAVEKGKLEEVKRLLAAGVSPNSRDRLNKATALMWAMRKQENEEGNLTAPMEAKYEVARALLRAGADVNAKNVWGGTALQWAAEAGNLEMARELVAAKAEVNTGDSAGLTPLMVAANYETAEHQEIVRLLLDAGANVNAADQNGVTALMKAALNHFKTDTVALLIEAKANVNAKNSDGYSALMLACRSGRAGVARFLIERGADTKAKTGDGLTVLQVAQKAGYKETIQALTDAGVTE